MKEERKTLRRRLIANLKMCHESLILLLSFWLIKERIQTSFAIAVDFFLPKCLHKQVLLEIIACLRRRKLVLCSGSQCMQTKNVRRQQQQRYRRRNSCVDNPCCSARQIETRTGCLTRKTSFSDTHPNMTQVRIIQTRSISLKTLCVTIFLGRHDTPLMR